jgi:hypothetical protein
MKLGVIVSSRSPSEMIIEKLKVKLCMLYCLFGLGLNAAKIPGEFNHQYKLPAEVEAIVDAMDAFGYLPPAIAEPKKNGETYLAQEPIKKNLPSILRG